jgi:DNA-dependent protein kinase catalytic subunit
MNSIVRDVGVSADAGSEPAVGMATKVGRPLLQARTFIVVPMSPKVGVLEWVKNTIPLKSIITDEMSRDSDFVSQNPRCVQSGRQGTVDLSSIVASEERLKWLKGMHDPQSYHDMIKKAKSESAQKLWRKMTRTIPDDFLRRYFSRISSSPEVFLTLRSECAKSLSVSCIFGYILGLGDRHLDNLLLDSKGGSIVQIDFGICFGMGASVLPVPELIPFRLSPQLRALFQPLDGTNLLRHYMIETLTSLRSDDGRQSLKNALEIYVNDPVVDWLKAPLMKDELRELINDVKWEPRRRINNAVKKTNGYHPVQLMLEDLKLNAHVKQLGTMEPIRQMLWQSANLHSPANALAESSRRDDCMLMLDPASQVDVLINLATDPNILVRHWVGLLTWI